MLQQQNAVRGFLASVGLDPEILVEFQYNPTQLSDKRSISYAALSAPALIMPVRQYSHGGDRTFSFTVRLDGLFKGPADDEIPLAKDEDGSIWPELNKYRAFLYPKTSRWQERATRSSFVGLYNDLQQFTSPPTCRFGFGEDRVINCIVTEVNITELLFNTQLAPLRADVSVTLVELAPYEDIGATI
jgi:Contractile injection system tube protein